MKWLAEHLLLPLIVSIGGVYLVVTLISPPPLPNIEPTVIYNSGPLKRKISNSFEVDIKEEKNAWLRISILNNGEGPDQDLDIDFFLKNDIRIEDIDQKYIPVSLRKREIYFKHSDESFNHRFSNFPSDSSVDYFISLSKFIVSDEDYNLSILSSHKNWSKTLKIKPEKTSFLFPFLKVAYAKEKPIVTASSTSIASVYIGGYDPLKIANDIFMLLQKHRLITKEDAHDMKNIIESYKEGVLFGGVNLIKFNEVMINKLITRNKITLQQAKDIVEKSRGAGGVLIGGYNMIALEVGLLNVLLENGEITKEEGQRILDGAKQPTNKLWR